MPSDTPILDRVTTDILAALGSALPDGYVIRAAEADAPTAALVPTLYYEQGDIVTTINGGRTPPGHVGVEFTLTLAAPEADPKKGTATVTDEAMLLLAALDTLDNLFWDRAEKIRLETGETCYRLAVVHLARYVTTN